MGFLRAQSGVESGHESGSDVFPVGMRVFACFFFWLVVPGVATNSETLGFCCSSLQVSLMCTEVVLGVRLSAVPLGFS